MSGDNRTRAQLRGREIRLVPRVTEAGHLVLELEQYNRRNCKQDLRVDVSLDNAKLFLRQWQGAIDEAYRREKEAFKAAARELEPGGSP